MKMMKVKAMIRCEKNFELARIVLDSRHGFQYRSQSWIDASDRLVNFLMSDKSGQIAAVTGPSGSGVTMMFRRLILHPAFDGVKISAKIEGSDSRLVDHICAEYGLTPPDMKFKRFPLALAQYLRLTGKKHLLIDDLDCLSGSAQGYSKLADEISKLQTAEIKLNLIISTRSRQLLTQIAKHCVDISEIRLERALFRDECVQLINQFWDWCNAHFALDFGYPEQALKACAELEFEIDKVMAYLEYTYAAKILFGASFDSRSFASQENLMYEVESYLYG